MTALDGQPPLVAPYTSGYVGGCVVLLMPRRPGRATLWMWGRHHTSPEGGETGVSYARFTEGARRAGAVPLLGGYADRPACAPRPSGLVHLPPRPSARGPPVSGAEPRRAQPAPTAGS